MDYPDISGIMMFKLLTYSGLLFSYVPKSTFRSTRTERNLQGLIDIHHIIPRQLRNHPTIVLSKYNIENGYNFMFLPTNVGVDKLNIHKNRPIHIRGHPRYNSYVASVLDQMFLEKQTSEYNMCKLNKKLRQSMRHLDIPWY